MATQTMTLDPNAQSYSDLADLDSAAASKLAGIAEGAEVNPTDLADLDSTAATKLSGIAEGAEVNPADLAELDSTAATKLGNAIITSPTTGQFNVIAIQRDADGKLAVSYDDVAE